ncbi:hypothetical protein O6H91_06G000200 [Diphasiastrum complanatum]|uniref:Uncharacterized protein n=1 Tax=Diphasiastrum complanatum TaxID=34168 RepID=A0ACC2DA70_DIPCM|nr:hypothetical protein O6H91_06G000200 [Diphasiastrum complanatum]
MKTRVVKKGSIPSKGLDDGSTPSKGPEEGSTLSKGVAEEESSIKTAIPGPKVKKVIVKKKVVPKSIPSQAGLAKGGSLVAAEIIQSASESKLKSNPSENLKPTSEILKAGSANVKEVMLPPADVDSKPSLSRAADEDATAKGVEAVLNDKDGNSTKELSKKTIVKQPKLSAGKEKKLESSTAEITPARTHTQATASSASGKKVKKIVIIRKVVKRKRESIAIPSIFEEEGPQLANAEGIASHHDERTEVNVEQDAVIAVEDKKQSVVIGQVAELARSTEEISTIEAASVPIIAEMTVAETVKVKGSEHPEYDQQRPTDEKVTIAEETSEHLQEEFANIGEKDEVSDDEAYEDLHDEMEGEYDAEDGQGNQQEGEAEVGIDEQGDIADFTLEYPDAQQVMPVSKKQKNRKFEVFVGGLDKDATEEDLKKAFERVGEVTEVRLIRNPQTGKNKGYAFVRFASVAQAKRAATQMERVEVRGRECGVLPNEENDILFVGNINKTWNKDLVEETLQNYGVENIEELTLMEDPHNERANRGFAFIEFLTHKDALNAFDRLRQPNVLFGTDRFAKIAWAEPFNDPDEEVMAQVKSVFVEGLPPTWDEERVKSTFGKFGEITRVVLSRHMPFAKRTDFAFVNYATREAALACIEAMGSMELVEGDSKVKVKVMLAKPQPKSRAVRGAIRGGSLFGRSGGHFGTRGFYRGGRFADGWGRGAGRFGFPRAGLRGGRGYSYGFSRGRFMGPYSDQQRSGDEKSRVKELLRVLREQASQEDEPSSSQKAPEQQGQIVHDQATINGKAGDVEHVTGSLENQGAKAAFEKYQCHGCGFGSDIESDYLKHTSSRIHKVIEEHRGGDNFTNKTPISLLHEYAARHRCEVHYDIKADDPLGPFEVLATIGGGGTGVPLTKGVAKGCSKAKARQMAAADALEKIMERIPDLQFSRSYQPKQLAGERPFGTGARGHSFRGGRGRGLSRGGTFAARQDGRRLGLGGYGHDESMFDDSVPVGVRSRGRHLPHGPDVYESGHLGADREAGIRGPMDFIPRGKNRAPGHGQSRDRYGASGDYSESFLRERESSDEHSALAAHREAYFQRLGGGPGYDNRTAIREYGEAMVGGKRPYSVLEDDHFMESHRGNVRARLEHIEPFPAASGSTQYPGGTLYGSSSSYIGGPVPQTAGYALYDSHLSGVDVSGLYAGAGDYGGGLEVKQLTGASSYPSSVYDLYSQAPSVAGGFSISGAGPGSLF